MPQVGPVPSLGLRHPESLSLWYHGCRTRLMRRRHRHVSHAHTWVADGPVELGGAGGAHVTGVMLTSMRMAPKHTPGTRGAGGGRCRTGRHRCSSTMEWLWPATGMRCGLWPSGPPTHCTASGTGRLTQVRACVCVDTWLPWLATSRLTLPAPRQTPLRIYFPLIMAHKHMPLACCSSYLACPLPTCLPNRRDRAQADG